MSNLRVPNTPILTFSDKHIMNICCYQCKIEIYFNKWAQEFKFAEPRGKIHNIGVHEWNTFLSVIGKKNSVHFIHLKFVWFAQKKLHEMAPKMFMLLHGTTYQNLNPFSELSQYSLEYYVRICNSVKKPNSLISFLFHKKIILFTGNRKINVWNVCLPCTQKHT